MVGAYRMVGVQMVVAEIRAPDFADPVVEVVPPPAVAPGYAAIVRVCGDHDIATLPRIRETLELIAGSVLIDLSDCTFLDSSVINAFVDEAHERRRKWRSLELIVPAANERVGRTLWMAGVSELLIVHESTDFRQIQL
jgi:anti-anti-sigma factor